MSVFTDIVNKYSKIAKDLPTIRLQLAMDAATDGLQLVIERLQERGEGAEGQKFDRYSEAMMPYWLINPNNYKGSGKVSKFKKNAAAKRNNGSYRALRKAYGLPTDKRTFTFEGDMLLSLDVFLESHNADETIVVTKARSRGEQDKVNWNSGMVDSNILSYNKEEIEFISQANLQRVQKLLK
jgi:hypothetical protein